MMPKLMISDDVVVVEENGKRRELPIGSPEAFSLISNVWLRSGWDAKYVYSFTWLGRPIIQLPEDILRIQELIYSIKPDVIIETGVAHGGSLVLYATLCKAMQHGRVIGIDIEIRPHNRKAIEEHMLSGYIDLIEGSSTDERTVELVRQKCSGSSMCMVVLDSSHTKEHVQRELEIYADFVGLGSYIVACDGIMKDLVGAPRSNADWAVNNPQQAVEEFLRGRNDFILELPALIFNEGDIEDRVTYWPSAWLKRVR